MKNFKQTSLGFTLVEVLISASIILISTVAVIGVHSLYLKTALNNAESIKATYLVEEGIEVIRFWRDSSWNNKIKSITQGTAYGLTLIGSTWSTTTNQYIGSFQRRVTLSAVNRSASNDIVTSGGTLDPNTLLVTSSVSWAKGGATTTKTIATYITNLYGN